MVSLFFKCDVSTFVSFAAQGQSVVDVGKSFRQLAAAFDSKRGTMRDNLDFGSINVKSGE